MVLVGFYGLSSLFAFFILIFIIVIIIIFFLHRVLAEGRDGAITCISKNAARSVCGSLFLRHGGVKALLMAALCTKPSVALEGKVFGDIAVTSETRMNISIALSKVCEATRKDKNEPSDKFLAECLQHISSVLELCFIYFF